ncbi:MULTISPECIES: type VII secretion protein EccB [unclassified Actinopolyspora]|uniref:type VII secretion protein EccB n=1 Tax=unclassified Actinopolyspora TaxID=2639451 RepID=UPI0013F66DB3|nr:MULTISPECIES: type VII secretion protein EccB [unclassified Actinopolyspora]NHD19513.1 type VII secretion protein EccB [Actinopolyspora sp. BKK2]NHE78669.1 type VII secretion protein EccB [Actinopolyspora sp. BKK1]
MQSRRDQVQAYFFVVGRLMSALMRASPDDQTTPTRRFVMGTVIGTLLGALVVAGFGIVGLIFPGGKTSWQAEGTIVVEKETGARYLYLDGTLRPVLNYASALLARDEPGADPELVSRNSLRGTPRGTPIGIPGAPDSIPERENLSRSPWVVCARTTTNPSGKTVPITHLRVGSPAGHELGTDDGLVVATPDGTKYLLWQGSRLKLTGSSVTEALGYGDVTPFPVTTSWLNTLPSGPDLAAPEIPDAGGPAPAVAGRPATVGRIYEMRNPALEEKTSFYVMRSDGLSTLTPLVASLMLADPSTPDSKQPVEIGPEALSSTPISDTDTTPQGYPATPPTPEQISQDGGTRPCASFRVGSGQSSTPTLAVAPRDANSTGTTTPPESGETAERITIPSGRGVLARDLPAPGVAGGTNYLITGLGVKYPLATPDVAGVLGYERADPVPVPGALLSLLPSGPSLDPNTATVTRQPGTTGDSSP